MRTVLLALFAALAVSVHADDPPYRMVIHLLDPRGALAGDQTVSIEWHDRVADVIATRRLNRTEAKKLRTLLRKDLADDANVPFCGHSPAYAVSITPEGKSMTTVTLCGTCGTWAKKGKLRALHGKGSLEYLDVLLPLPDVFRAVDGKPPELLMPFFDGKKIPFHELEAVDGG